MQEKQENDCGSEESGKPTITIAEKEGRSASAEGKPTITIAEKEGGATSATAEQKPTITIAEKEGDVGIMTSPDGWELPWAVKKKKK